MTPTSTDYPSIGRARALSDRAWALTEAVLPSALARPLKGAAKLVRPGRAVMIAALTWVSAHVAGVAPESVAAVTLAGLCLAMAGFAIDAYADREADRRAPRPWPINPLSADLMSARTARHLIVFFVAAGLVAGALVHSLTLVPAAALLAIYWGLAAGHLDGRFGRAVTLGALQALYVLLAAAATGRITLTMWLVAAVFLAAMFGARAAADIRDLPSDEKTDTRTLAKAYGIKRTSWILPVAMTVSFGFTILVYAAGEFDRDYIVWTGVGYGLALVMAWSFPFYASPNLAFALGIPYWTVGALYLLALYLGSR